VTYELNGTTTIKDPNAIHAPIALSKMLWANSPRISKARAANRKRTETEYT
jgi:hypothetical protein